MDKTDFERHYAATAKTNTSYRFKTTVYVGNFTLIVKKPHGNPVLEGIRLDTCSEV